MHGRPSVRLRRHLDTPCTCCNPSLQPIGCTASRRPLTLNNASVALDRAAPCACHAPHRDIAEEHYKDLASKPFFPALVEYILSGPVVCMVGGRWVGGWAGGLAGGRAGGRVYGGRAGGQAGVWPWGTPPAPSTC